MAKNVKRKVFRLLREHPELRDCDQQLIATFWYNEIGKDKLELMSAIDLIQVLANADIANTETIRRYRSEFQQKHSNLRSQKYFEARRAKIRQFYNERAKYS
jgi:hypothetical protein